MLAHDIKLPWITPDNAVVQIVGEQPLVLSQDYDPRQFWLPFSNFLILFLRPQPEHHEKISIKKRLERTFAIVSHHHRPLYVFEENVPQLLLPFKGWRKVSKTGWIRLTDAKHPGWERDAENRLYNFGFDPKQHEDVEAFCEDNCRGRFYLKKKGRIFLELQTDFLITKIAFGIAS